MYAYPPPAPRQGLPKDAPATWIPAPAPPRSPDALRPLIATLRGRRVALYGHDLTHWTAAALPGIRSYDLRAWYDRHYFKPYQPACRHLSIRDDPTRHQRLHEWYATVGRQGLCRDFLQHIQADQAAGREVWLSASARDPALRWLREAGYTVEPRPQVRSLQPLWRIGGSGKINAQMKK
jgi:hypothetical protein